ncbi:hypothetical protein F5X96DRAFT_616333 [Biscogniauxia mediterranea]|nr:hypothetical protein F5X96DRAFT_616333 [Biscogniauxia mediterranea]
MIMIYRENRKQKTEKKTPFTRRLFSGPRPQALRVTLFGWLHRGREELAAVLGQPDVEDDDGDPMIDSRPAMTFSPNASTYTSFSNSAFQPKRRGEPPNTYLLPTYLSSPRREPPSWTACYAMPNHGRHDDLFDLSLSLLAFSCRANSTLPMAGIFPRALFYLFLCSIHHSFIFLDFCVF